MSRALVSFGMLLSGMIGLAGIYACAAFGQVPYNHDFASLLFLLFSVALVIAGLVCGIPCLKTKN